MTQDVHLASTSPFSLFRCCGPPSPEAWELNPAVFTFLHLPCSPDFGVGPTAFIISTQFLGIVPR